MPFTPIHFGVGALAKAAAPKRFSFQVFALSQVLMDIEPGIRLWRGDAILHGPSHTWAGAVLIALATCLVWSLWELFGPRRYVRKVQLHGLLAAAFFGTLTHVALDGMMHGDMPYTWLREWSLATPAYPAGAAVPELICLAAAVLAAALLVIRDVTRRLWHREQVEQ